jgi:hypothetical protein
VKLYAPEEFAVVVALDAPLNVTTAPLPPVPVIVPDMEYVTAVAVNAGTVTLVPLTVALWLDGLNV